MLYISQIKVLSSKFTSGYTLNSEEAATRYELTGELGAMYSKM